MNTSSMPRAIRLQRAWSARAADRLAELWTQLRHRLAAAYERWRERREMADVMELDAATLRDMGMPLWMQEEARTRQERRALDNEIDRLNARSGLGRFY